MLKRDDILLTIYILSAIVIYNNSPGKSVFILKEGIMAKRYQNPLISLTGTTDYSNSLSLEGSMQLYPVVIDMCMIQPLPVYSAYCREGTPVDIEKMANNPEASFPCMICGERGTARSSVATILYQLLEQKNNTIPSFRIDCSLLDKRSYNLFFETEYSMAPDNGMYLFFYELYKAPMELQEKLCSYLTANKCWVAATLQNKPEYYIDRGLLHAGLAQLLYKNLYCMPPLRDSPKEILFLSNLLLSHYNVEYGRKILGFGSDAQKTLEKYDWPGNITQLSQLVSILVRQTKELYISDSLLRFYLSKDDNPLCSDTFWVKIDFSMTLSEINRHIVECVLQQENWNQSQAAKRLDISRSTLWRMLRDT